MPKSLHKNSVFLSLQTSLKVSFRLRGFVCRVAFSGNSNSRRRISSDAKHLLCRKALFLMKYYQKFTSFVKVWGIYCEIILKNRKARKQDKLDKKKANFDLVFLKHFRVRYFRVKYFRVFLELLPLALIKLKFIFCPANPAFRLTSPRGQLSLHQFEEVNRIDQIIKTEILEVHS